MLGILFLGLRKGDEIPTLSYIGTAPYLDRFKMKQNIKTLANIGCGAIALWAQLESKREVKERLTVDQY